MPTQPSDHSVFHIATRSQWEDAQHRETHRAETLESEGFIHCSAIHQVLPVANALFGVCPRLEQKVGIVK